MNLRRMSATCMARLDRQRRATAIAGKTPHRIKSLDSSRFFRLFLAVARSSVRQLSSSAGAPASAQHAQRDGHAIAARQQKAHLPRLFLLVGGRGAKALPPQRRGVGQFVGCGERRHRGERLGRGNALFPQCVGDGALAVASAALRDDGIGIACIGQVARRRELVERTLDVVTGNALAQRAAASIPPGCTRAARACARPGPWATLAARRPRLARG